MLAWLVLAVSAGALCIVVAVAGGRAPSATPFFASGVGVAVGAGTGALLQASKRKLALSPVAHAAVVVGVAFIAVLPAGFLKYTYGGEGSVVVTLNAAPLTLDWGSAGVVSGTVSLYNDGATTVRIYPQVEITLTDASGLPRPKVVEGCPLVTAPGPTERDLVEVAPGAVYDYAFTARLSFVDQSGASGGCGAFLISNRGTYHLRAALDSHPFGGFLLVPVWTGALTSEPAALLVR